MPCWVSFKEQLLQDIMDDFGLEQIINFPTRAKKKTTKKQTNKKNTLVLILTSLSSRFQDIYSSD